MTMSSQPRTRSFAVRWPGQNWIIPEVENREGVGPIEMLFSHMLSYSQRLAYPGNPRIAVDQRSDQGKGIASHLSVTARGASK